ncbi:hypothetical protein V6M78_000317 [Yersinia enterocolitica]
MGLDVAMHAKSTTDGLFIVRKTRQHNLEAQLKKQQAALDKQKTGLNTFRTAPNY